MASAKQILVNLGKSEATEISPDDTAETVKFFANTGFTGDGVGPVDAAEDAVVQGIIADIMACFGSETDRSGKPGITQERADHFFAERRRCWIPPRPISAAASAWGWHAGGVRSS